MMENEDDHKSFLTQLENLHVFDVVYHKENLPLVLAYEDVPDEVELFTSQFNHRLQARERSGLPLQGVDLFGVKHYNHSDLKAFTHDIEEKCVIGRTIFGRILEGKIQHDSVTKDVTLKTWDIAFNPRPVTTWHPLRLSNEIKLLTTEPLRSHRNVAKLIGYSIDKVFAVVYDFKSNKSLRSMLQSEHFGWHARVKVAIQVGRLIEDLHKEDIIIGSIDPSNIMIDEEDNIKLCEFGLRSKMQETKAGDVHWWSSGGVYSIYIPDLRPGGKWTKETDIYAYGNLLLELITAEQFDIIYLIHGGETLKCWASDKLSGGIVSLVDKSFIEDEVIGSEITQLVMNCLIDNPHQRCKVKTVADKFEDLIRLQEGSVSRKQKAG